jgi:hypothetical protein
VNITAADAGSRSRSSRFRLSRASVTVLLASFLTGIAKGAVAYAHRSPIPERHVAGSNAITVHVILAIVGAVAVVAVQARRSRRPGAPGTSPWAAPFSAHATQRLSRTVRFADGPSPRNVARVVATVVLVVVLLYAPFRIGAEITGGLDPNATVNAWGGPTYLGALLAHSLDAIEIFYADAFLLDRLLLRAAPGDETGPARA